MIGILFALFIATIVSIIWVNSIDKMNNDFPDYDGEDFLN